MHRRWRPRPAARWLGGALAVTVAGGGVWWFGLRDDAAAAPAVATQTVAASLSTLEKTVSASGTVAPTVLEEVSFEAAGTVTTVQVAAGDTVTAGQVLATIDTLQLNASLLEARATLASAQARLASAEDEDDGSDAAQAQATAASAQVDVAQAAVETAQAQMDAATLVAPAAGLVTEVNLEVGDVVAGSGGAGGSAPSGSSTSAASSEAQVVVVGTDSWTVEVTVDDSEVALVEVGDQAELTLEDATDLVFGTVAEIGLVSTSTGGVAAFPVTIEITGQPEGVYDGVAADVEIVYERRTDVLTVPSAAVRTVDGESVVSQLDADGDEVETAVTVGETVGDVTEITAGLAEGDEVVVAVVTRTSDGGGTPEQDGIPGGMQLPEGFDPTQMQLPEGFDPTQMQRPGQGGTDG